MASVLTVIVPVRNFTGSFVFWTPSPFPTPSPTAVPLPNNVVLTFGGAWKHHVAGHNQDLYCLNTAALGGPGKPSFVSDIYDFETTGEKAPGECGPGRAVTAVDVKSQSVEILLDGITDGMFTSE